MTILNLLRFFKRILKETPDEGSNRQWRRTEEESNPNETSDKTNKSASKSLPTKSNKQKQQRFQGETPDEGSNCQRGRTEEESDPNETSDKTNKSTSKSSLTKSNKQKQQRFQEETPSEGSNRQRGRTEEESDPNETSDKTNKSTSKSSLTKSNKQKQQRFQEETPSEGSKRQRGKTEEESDSNEMSDKTNKSTSKSAPIKLILKSEKSTKPTQEESTRDVIGNEKRYGNIRIPQKFVLVVKDDQGNEKVIDDDDTDLEADENDNLRESLNRYLRICLPKAIHRQTDLEQLTKCQKRIKTKKSERYEEESEEEGSGSNNNDEYDEKEARAEIKSILKTIDETRGLDYNETFNSAKNLKIRRKLVPELRSALAPCFSASNKQLTKWLGYLHKSRRSHQRLMDRGKADENKHRVHSNNRVHDKKICRMKVAKRLYSFYDERITKYDKHRLLKMLSNRLFHSPEISKTDEEDPTKSIIAIYDYSWRSDELKNLLRNILDVYSSNKVKLIRERRYDDEVQKYDRPHPSNAPKWSYIIQQQDLIFDTDIDQGFNTEYNEEVEEISRGTTPATGNTTENDEDHNKEGEEKPSKSTVGNNHNNSDSDLHMDDAQ
ncbi:unnamed protein product [Rhizophagus irregularis]|uniref:Uncharacterized protein n=1 Tax=Rhizophagus irregularis TaxID=588596 RepID=A0A915Z6B2_9GLOM|nr:unnamed protein product [Rhizophagus irregularis]